jgi:putative flippase GtrA
VTGVKSRLMRAWAWAHSHDGRKVVRFASVSVISTVVSYVFITLFVDTGWVSDAVTATIYGNLIATVPSYQLNRSWTWGKKGRSHIRKEVIPFWALSLAGIAFSVVGAIVAKNIVNSHHLHRPLSAFVVATFNVFSFAVFWVLKLWFFNRIFHVDVLKGMDEHLALEEESQREGRSAPT